MQYFFTDLISTPRLYIGKIGSSIKKHDIVSAFGVYGEITDMLMKDDFAFIVIHFLYNNKNKL